MEVVLFLWFIFGILGAWISSQKGRSGGEGFALGCLFGPIGVLVAALLPVLPPPVPQASLLPPPAPIVLTPEDIEAARQRAADELVRRELEQEAASKRSEAARLESERKQAEFLRQVREQQERETARQVAEDRLRRQAKEMRARQRNEQIRLFRQRLANMPEGAKVAIGVLSGVLGIAVLLALILMIVGKGDEPAARPQPVVAQQSKPVPPKPAPVEIQPQALLAERSLTEPRAVSTAVSTKQDPGKAGTSTADAQVPAESTPTLVQPESLLGSATPAEKVPASITRTEPNPRPEEHPTDPHQAFLNQLAHMTDPMSEQEHTQALKELTRINPRLVQHAGAPPEKTTTRKRKPERQ